jgi:glycosyltransferase involved in cell wall biosynthesis
MKPLLSILTPTIPERAFPLPNSDQANKLAILNDKIDSQRAELCQPWKDGNTWPSCVEHLILCDNRTRTIGAKRQALVDIARGEYIAFVDDDDDISDDYVTSLLAAIQTGADVITFRQRAIYNGLESEVVFGINNQDEPFNPGGITLRAPWHVCAWKRDKVAGCLFSESNYGEDRVWCLQARQRIRTAHHVDKVLHTYRHDAATTAAPEL